MDALTLKQKLQHIQSANRSINNEEQPYELALHMLKHIGSPDPVLRDELIYVIFATWIGQGVFSEDQLRHVLQLALDDQHLFYGIGEQGTDSVFTRTFSVLLLPPILNVDREKPFLNEEDIAGIHHRLITYLECEKDLRGYVDDKGWAHAPAHAADAVEDLAQSPYLERMDLLELLHAISRKITESSEVYLHDEDQRIAHAIITILRRNLLEQKDITLWMNSLHQGDMAVNRSLLETSHRNLNVRLFLQTLYLAIRTEEDEPFPAVRSLVLLTLEREK
ncbi:DUF2785 domain-containing protein [Paenibacillus sp. 1781tsa1]|uniref:DUF2785 domain-containing protein n=1 Tax=Paenibacillus sp. 1781tsa1 TaxID=2953810 RepID=UPI0020A10BB9|nr:DUF2785 domain-containing protein [Paenibacillus sp. 1781tsa1]MCP1181854.1 DUF2785 domain-containing protein [Paenibacillus sp. 1781tsa1]